MIYRSKIEIISVILQTAGPGSSITKIMYNAFLSYALVKKYINFLMENQMLAYEKNTHHYKTTEKGKRFMRMYGEINKLFSSKLNNTNEFSTLS